MSKSVKVLFVYKLLSPFIKDDMEILHKHFDVFFNHCYITQATGCFWDLEKDFKIERISAASDLRTILRRITAPIIMIKPAASIIK